MTFAQDFSGARREAGGIAVAGIGQVAGKERLQILDLKAGIVDALDRASRVIHDYTRYRGRVAVFESARNSSFWTRVPHIPGFENRSYRKQTNPNNVGGCKYPYPFQIFSPISPGFKIV
jgi:hypothetical protein